MRIELNENPEQVELIRAMASPNKLTALEAQETFAAFVGPVLQEVLKQAGTTGRIYTTFTYDEDDSPSIPLDTYFDTKVGHIVVWTQHMAGGIPTSQPTGMQELKLSSYPLNSAVSLNKKYARRARLDVVSAAIDRMLQEVLVKQERNGWAIILKALGEASTNVNGTATKHTITSTTQNQLQLDDFNRLITLSKRLNMSFAGGTPVEAYSRGATDLFMSPEMMEDVREMAYQPVNTRNGATTTSGATSLALPDSMRLDIYRNAGAAEIYGKTLHELLELGVGYKYNVLFGSFASGNIAHGSQTFDSADDEVIIGIDLAKRAFRRGLARKADSGGTFTVETDDQFLKRADKIGWYGSLEEARVCLDGRAISGIVV